MMKPLEVKPALQYLIALTLGLVLGFLYMTFFETNSTIQNTIVVTKDGFVPKVLSIKQGERVTFISDGSVEAFWPASDSHPSHGIYPEFDAKKPIDAKDSWSFVFRKTGSWKAHDHMNPHLRGEIVVYSSEGTLNDTCVKRETGTGVKFQPECWETEFKNLLQKFGQKELFHTIDSYIKTDEVFKNNCHDVMHIVGRLAHGYYLSDGEIIFDTNTTSCGYGFFHGFVESIYSETGSYFDSRKFCDDLESSDQFQSKELAKGAAAACWHGVGHAIFDSQDSKNWGDVTAMIKISLDECELVFSELKQRQECSGGVFNALDVAFSNNLYGLNFDDNDPFSHCKDIIESYKNYCIFDAAVFYSSFRNFGRTEALALFATVEDKYFPEILTAWVSDNIQWRSTGIEMAYQEAQQCFEYDEKIFIDACMNGVHLGTFKKNGPLINQAESNKICDLFDDETKKAKCQEFIYIRDRDL